MPFFAGKLFTAFVVRKWGALGGGAGQLLGGGPVQSWTAGQSWTMGQYILAGLAAHFGAKLFGRSKMLNASAFRKGGFDLIFTKLMWTEGIARSEWAKQQFGNAGNVAYSPGTGQTWLSQGGQSVAMQGGVLVEASPLDGELVTATPLDGMASYTSPAADPYRAAYA